MIRYAFLRSLKNERVRQDSKSFMMIVKVAIPNTPFDHFDYVLETTAAAASVIGCRVIVPFRNRTCVGIILELAETSALPVSQLKYVSAVIDTTAVLSPEILQLCYWASQYYQSAMGDMLIQALPTRLRSGKIAAVTKPRQHKNSSTDTVNKIEPALTLNAEQQQAVTTITGYFHQYQCLLLQGVTGSGKTEVYLQVIAKVLSNHQQALILVPEIGLTPQLVERFQQRFQVPIATMHSGLNDSERCNAWLQAKTGQAALIIGTRSAVFTPIPHLGIIVVDEEHDVSFKQQEGLRYNARDVAIMRAQMQQVPVILGSATPSLETLHNAQTGKYQPLRLQHRAMNLHKTHIKIIDMRNQKLTRGLSNPLIDAIKQHLAQEQQVLVFVNRRGYAPILLCHQCAWIADCKHCDAHLTFHFADNYLHCHHCDQRQLLPRQCQRCHGTQLIPLGMGTERLEHNLQQLFPQAKILRVDRDTTRKKHELKEKLAVIAREEANLLIGTQMLAKGHHFPNLTLVAIVNADQGFFSQDFRASERLGQLILQVAGRAGRAQKPGTMMIQTHVPDHPLLNALLQQGYPAFTQLLLADRRAAQLPPFSYLALLRCKAKHETQAQQLLQLIKDFLKTRPNSHTLIILGPAPAPLAKKAGLHRMQLLLSSPQRKPLSQAIGAIRSHQFHRSGCQLTIDIDPLDLA